MNNKGFTLIELLTVMVILVTILLIAIPSITSSLTRSENKQLEAQKESIASNVVLNARKKDFNNSYNDFKNGVCVLNVETLFNLGYITDALAKDKKDNFIQGCVGYQASELKFLDTCGSECAMNG